MSTILHVYLDLSASGPNLYHVSAGYRTISRSACTARDVLMIVRDIQRGRWWSLCQHVVIIRH